MLTYDHCYLIKLERRTSFSSEVRELPNRGILGLCPLSRDLTTTFFCLISSLLRSESAWTLKAKGTSILDAWSIGMNFGSHSSFCCSRDRELKGFKVLSWLSLARELATSPVVDRITVIGVPEFLLSRIGVTLPPSYLNLR